MGYLTDFIVENHPKKQGANLNLRTPPIALAFPVAVSYSAIRCKIDQR